MTREQPDSASDWEGHPFACVLRVDVEHREAERYTGDPRTERVATAMLLDQLAQWDVRASCAVLGITAEHYPDVVRWVTEAGHDVIGHSMFHAPAYPDLSLADQRWDHRRSVQAIEAACGRRIRGLAAHYHGLTNDDTFRAAVDEGLEFVLGRHPETAAPLFPAEAAAQSTFLAPFRLPDRERPVLARAGQHYGASDWSARRREWPWIEEPWSAPSARERWLQLVDRAREAQALVTFVVHPWMLHINEGEVAVARDVLAYARDRGAWMTTYTAVADRAWARHGRPST